MAKNKFWTRQIHQHNYKTKKQKIIDFSIGFLIPLIVYIYVRYEQIPLKTTSMYLVMYIKAFVIILPMIIGFAKGRKFLVIGAIAAALGLPAIAIVIVFFIYPLIIYPLLHINNMPPGYWVF